MVEQAAAGIGQPNAAAAALQQGDVEHLLHAADARACRRKREVRALGPVRDAAGLGDVAEQAEVGEIEAHGQPQFGPKSDSIFSTLSAAVCGQLCAMASSILILVCLVFVLAGFTKGVIGLGLPTIAMGLLAVVLPPAEAAALLILPSLVTNVWQMLDGPHLGRAHAPAVAAERRRLPWHLAGAALLAGIGGRYGGLALAWRCSPMPRPAWPRCGWSCRAWPSPSLAR